MSDHQVLVTQSILLLIHKEEWRKNVSRLQKDFNFFTWRITYPGISVLQTPADSMIAKQDILEVARKQAQKRESCYQVKYLKTVGLSVFFSLTSKSVTSSNSSEQMAARNTLKPASCLPWTHYFGVLTPWLYHGFLFHSGLIQGDWRWFETHCWPLNFNDCILGHFIFKKR